MSKPAATISRDVAPRKKGNDIKITMRYPKRLKERLDALAAHGRHSINDELVIALEERLERSADVIDAELSRRRKERR